jgi:glycosyltransferase involved in cell wall biosynthesis
MKIVAILPAYNAARTIVPFVRSLPNDVFDDIIVSDDSSPDGTFAVAKKIHGIFLYSTPHNLGYGGNVKQCLQLALKKKADVIVELHPDGEYGLDGIAPALAAVKKGALLVLGNRFAGDPIGHGMRRSKYAVTRLLTGIDNLLLGTRIPDLHQGFRVYTKKFLTDIPFEKGSNDYRFSFEIIVEAIRRHIPIASVPVTVHYTGNKRGASVPASIVYTFATFGILWKLFYETTSMPHLR